MDPAIQFLLLAALSVAVTWWLFFRECVTIRVAAKARKVVMAGYPTLPTGSRNWHPGGVLHEEYRCFLTDVTGREWIVSQSAYQSARVGRAITLRQWVDEWRPVAISAHFWSGR